MVDADVEEYEEVDMERFRASPGNSLRFRTLSASFSASCSSAIPFLHGIRYALWAAV